MSLWVTEYENAESWERGPGTLRAFRVPGGVRACRIALGEETQNATRCPQLVGGRPFGRGSCRLLFAIDTLGWDGPWDPGVLPLTFPWSHTAADARGAAVEMGREAFDGKLKPIPNGYMKSYWRCAISRTLLPPAGCVCRSLSNSLPSPSAAGPFLSTWWT